jgi:hypothetical protein
MRIAAVILALCIGGALIYYLSEERENSIPLTASDAFERGLCSQEAVLLGEDVLIAQELRAAPTIQADSGRAVYLCGKVDNFQRVVFPQENTPVDCTTRGSSNPCIVGFIKTPFETITLG